MRENQTTSPFQDVVLLRHKSQLQGNLVHTGILLGGVDPLSLSGKLEAFSKMKCPAGEEARLDRDLTFLFKSSKIELPGWDCWRISVFDYWSQTPVALQKLYCQKDTDQGPDSKQELEHRK